jgi:low affinity Fe/Cu permease
MKRKSSLAQFLVWSARMAGRPITFLIALLLLTIWLLIGLVFGFSDSWLLLINTIATVNASLMVFIIQNTQYRESKALHLKIDELLRKNQEVERAFIAIEEMEEEELERIKKLYHSEKNK